MILGLATLYQTTSSSFDFVFDSPVGFISVAYRDTNEELFTAAWAPYLSTLLKSRVPPPQQLTGYKSLEVIPSEPLTLHDRVLRSPSYAALVEVITAAVTSYM